MPDHEPMFGNPVKEVQPTSDIPPAAPYPPGMIPGITTPAFPPTGFQPGPAAGYDPGYMPPPPPQYLAPPPPPTMPPPVTPYAQFTFINEGKHYAATIHKMPGGLTLDLKKFEGSWKSSVSRLRYGILGAFIAQEAIAAAQQAANTAASVPPKVTPE